MKRKTISLFAALAIVVAACGGATSTAPSTGPSVQPSAATSTEPSGPNAELAAAMNKEYDGTVIDLVAQWIGDEGIAFDDSLDAFRDATGINVVFSGISNYETVLNVRVDGDLAPDIAQLAQAGRVQFYASKPHGLVDLDTVLDGDALRANYSPGFITAGSADGKLYGLYYRQDLKSIVWYPVKGFADKGYKIPTTWAELEALVEQIKTDGSSPWCTTIEHGDVSGWVATDWLEDVLLRTAPVETYDKFAAHEIPFTDPAVVNALNIVGKMWFTEGNTYGGSERINATWVGDSQTPMFDDPPKCWLHKQASWIPGFFPEGKVAEIDSKFFYLPGIDSQYGNPVLGGSDMFVMFNDRPEVRALMQWFTTPESVQSRIKTGGFLSASNAIPAEWYDKYPISGLAEIARNATVSRPDATDGMPAEVQKVIHAALIKWVAANGTNTDAILAEIEANYPK